MRKSHIIFGAFLSILIIGQISVAQVDYAIGRNIEDIIIDFIVETGFVIGIYTIYLFVTKYRKQKSFKQIKLS